MALVWVLVDPTALMPNAAVAAQEQEQEQAASVPVGFWIVT
jgi:hypothetical protein